MKKKMEKIHNNLMTKFGLDLNKYRKPKLMNLILATSSYLTNPLLSLIIPVISIFYILNMILVVWISLAGISFFGIILMFLLGNIGILIMGGSYGVMKLLNKFINDLTGLVKISLDLVQEAMVDISKLGKDKSMIPPISTLFEGMIFVVIHPYFEQILRNKLGSLAESLLKILNPLINVFIGQLLPLVRKNPARRVTEFEQKLIVMKDFIEETKNNVDSMIPQTVRPKVLWPVKLTLFISPVVTVLVLGIVHFLFR